MKHGVYVAKLVLAALCCGIVMLTVTPDGERRAQAAGQTLTIGSAAALVGTDATVTLSADVGSPGFVHYIFEVAYA
jgi:hypothetical protein